MVKMCLPAVITILIMVIYNMADIYFIGQLKDPYKVTGLSLCMPITTLLSALGSMIGTGASSCISVAMGRGDDSKVAHYSSFFFLFFHLHRRCFYRHRSHIPRPPFWI